MWYEFVCTFSYMGTNVCRGTYTPMCMHVCTETNSWPWGASSIAVYLLYWGSLPHFNPEVDGLLYLAIFILLQKYKVLASPVLGGQASSPPGWHLCRCWGLNSNPQACGANTLATGPYLQPLRTNVLLCVKVWPRHWPGCAPKASNRPWSGKSLL